MKPILISGAMDSEIDMLVRKINASVDFIVGQYAFFKGFLNGYPIIISKTGIGMANAAAATSIGILRYSPKAVINQGSAGAHSPNIGLADIVVGESVVNINSFEKPALDHGVEYKNWIHSTFVEYSNNQPQELKADPRLVEIYKDAYVGVLGSGDVWNKEKEFILWLNQNLKTLCEDMETAAVYAVCNEFSIPVIGIRVITNNEILGQDFNESVIEESQEFVLKHINNVIRTIK